MSKKLVVLGLAIIAGACAKAGKVNEVSKVEKGLARYQSMNVIVESPKEENKKYVEPVQSLVTQKLEKAQIFQKVHQGAEPAGDLVLRMVLLSREGGSKFARAFNMGGEAEMKFKCSLQEKQTGKNLGEFELAGSSLRESQTSVSAGGIGFDTKTLSHFDNLDQRAMTAAAEELAEYLKERK